MGNYNIPLTWHVHTLGTSIELYYSPLPVNHGGNNRVSNWTLRNSTQSSTIHRYHMFSHQSEINAMYFKTDVTESGLMLDLTFHFFIVVNTRTYAYTNTMQLQHEIAKFWKKINFIYCSNVYRIFTFNQYKNYFFVLSLADIKTWINK